MIKHQPARVALRGAMSLVLFKALYLHRLDHIFFQNFSMKSSTGPREMNQIAGSSITSPLILPVSRYTHLDSTGLCVVRISGGPARRGVRVTAIMGGFQYQLRANKLRSQGLDVHEWGSRVLREGCFGEDVLMLQNWLAEESYYNPVDGGYTGYFGSVTKEALQAWQRDNGVQVTGVFDAASKWAYLRGIESRATPKLIEASPTPAPLKTITPSVTTAVAPALQHASPTSMTGPGAPFFLAAALIATVALGRMATTVLRALKSSIASREDVVSSSNRSERAFSGSPPQPPRVSGGNGKATELKQRQPVLIDTTIPGSRLRRLSEDELQRYIAPMKGSSGNRTPLQRPAPRPLLLADDDAKNGLSPAQGALVSRHGMYYGGKQVLERVKQYLAEESGNEPPIGSAAQRLVQLGYDMQRTTHRVSKPAPGPSSETNKPGSSNGSFEDIPLGGDEAAAAPPAAVTDVAQSTSYSASSSDALLAGTELEAAPERPLRPVAVQRGGSTRSPLGGGNANAVAQRPAVIMKPAAPNPMPVPVVKDNQTKNSNAEQRATPTDPNETVVLSTRPVKLHKPARLANGSGSSMSSLDE